MTNDNACLINSDGNRAAWARALAAVRHNLEAFAAQPAQNGEGAPDPLPLRAVEAGDSSSALGRLVNAFHLTTFEAGILVLCAGIELEASFANLCAAAYGGGDNCSATFGLAFSALPDVDWNALSPSGPLRRWRL